LEVVGWAWAWLLDPFGLRIVGKKVMQFDPQGFGEIDQVVIRFGRKALRGGGVKVEG